MSRESRESRERIRHCNPNFAEISVKMRWFVTILRKWEGKPKVMGKVRRPI
jgi:hypothetical protein